MLTEVCSEKYLKNLIGRAKTKDALKRLDKLTQEEARMTAAQNLKVTHTVDDRVRGVADAVVAVNNRVAGVDDQMQRAADEANETKRLSSPNLISALSLTHSFRETITRERS